MSLSLRAAAATDVGNLRDNNQDDLLIIDDALFVVADGMGGHVAGEVASREAVEAMRDAFESTESLFDVRQAVQAANGAVWKRGTDDPSYRGMGTTVTAVAVMEGKTLEIANVGDSRTYLLRGGELEQLTQDHSFVQEAVRSGQLSQSQAESHPRRSQLTRALGVSPEVDVDVDVLEPLTGDRLLLCSDGLWDEVGDELITMVLTNYPDPEAAASMLVLWAKEAGGRDNITVIVLDVVDGGEGGRAISASRALDGSDQVSATSRSDLGAALVAEGEAIPVDGARVRRGRPAGDTSLMQSTVLTPSPSRSRLLTWRVVVFVVVLVGVVAAAAVIALRSGPAWTVGVDGTEVVVRDGNRITRRTTLELKQFPETVQAQLKRSGGKGQRVADSLAADTYVKRLVGEMNEGSSTPGGGVVTHASSSLPTASTAASTSSSVAGAPNPAAGP